MKLNTDSLTKSLNEIIKKEPDSKKWLDAMMAIFPNMNAMQKRFVIEMISIECGGDCTDLSQDHASR